MTGVAVVTSTVPDYALMMGVPARQRGWMSRHGHRIPAPDKNGIMVCPESGFRYPQASGGALPRSGRGGRASSGIVHREEAIR